MNEKANANCGCCGAPVYDPYIDPRWPWTLCDVCAKAKPAEKVDREEEEN